MNLAAGSAIIPGRPGKGDRLTALCWGWLKEVGRKLLCLDVWRFCFGLDWIGLGTEGCNGPIRVVWECFLGVLQGV